MRYIIDYTTGGIYLAHTSPKQEEEFIAVEQFDPGINDLKDLSDNDVFNFNMRWKQLAPSGKMNEITSERAFILMDALFLAGLQMNQHNKMMHHEKTLFQKASDFITGTDDSKK